MFRLHSFRVYTSFQHTLVPQPHLHKDPTFPIFTLRSFTNARILFLLKGRICGKDFRMDMKGGEVEWVQYSGGRREGCRARVVFTSTKDLDQRLSNNLIYLFLYI